MLSDNLTQTLQNIPILGMEIISLIIYFTAILVFYALLGKEGLYTFIAVAIIGANLQVLKVVDFPFFKDPVALGTILFSGTYLCTDALAEYEGVGAARKGVWIGFMAMLLWTVITTLTIGFKPLDLATIPSAEWAWSLPVHGRIRDLFTSVPTLFIAGMSAYLISQMHDVFIYRLMRKRHGKRLIWLRNNLSTMLSGLIDSTVFSLLAWVILAERPLELKVVIQTYILGTYIIRVIVALLDTPFLYLMRYARHWHNTLHIKKVRQRKNT
ncbi:queuosine precursor transporter [Candidatus Haliotispira prima]|uniref:Probable queuosine precursor transporter n=1 Tax=Candidatus Haliotispira prima TaxID=3034016 RepID=A0ABY8MJ43_9SPIO|nr:queuosine precursor transporter [Candidatus Haliotispira prima]